MACLALTACASYQAAPIKLDAYPTTLMGRRLDTRDGALAEAGDLLQARDEGKFDFANLKGDLFDLCRGMVKGRTSADEITLFKSAGTAIEDLATAIMLYQKAR